MGIWVDYSKEDTGDFGMIYAKVIDVLIFKKAKEEKEGYGVKLTAYNSDLKKEYIFDVFFEDRKKAIEFADAVREAVDLVIWRNECRILCEGIEEEVKRILRY
jgi:hypothetical protein